MRYYFLAFFLVCIWVSCDSSQKPPTALRTEIVEIWDDGLPKLVQLFDLGNHAHQAVREIHYYPDGQKYMEGPLLEGKRHGKWQSWYKSGMLWSTGDFEAGLRQGRGTIYHSNGKKFMEGNYLHGKRVGKWKFWDQAGNSITEAEALQLAPVSDDYLTDD